MALVMGVDFKSWITSSTMVLLVLMKTTFRRMAELAEITSSLCLEFTGNHVKLLWDLERSWRTLSDISYQSPQVFCPLLQLQQQSAHLSHLTSCCEQFLLDGCQSAKTKPLKGVHCSCSTSASKLGSCVSYNFFVQLVYVLIVEITSVCHTVIEKRLWYDREPTCHLRGQVLQGTHSGSCMYRAKHRRPEGDIKVDINKSLLEDLTTKMASRFTVIPEAFLNIPKGSVGGSLLDFSCPRPPDLLHVILWFASFGQLSKSCKELVTWSLPIRATWLYDAPSNLKVNDVCEVKWTDRKVYKAMIVTLGGHVKMEAKLAEMAEGKPELKAQVSCLQTQVTYLLRIRAQTESTDSSTESSSQCGSGCWLGDPNGEKMWVPGGDAKKVLAAQVVSDNPAKLALALLSVFFTDLKLVFIHLQQPNQQQFSGILKVLLKAAIQFSCNHKLLQIFLISCSNATLIVLTQFLR
eukprot:Em0001g2744a